MAGKKPYRRNEIRQRPSAKYQKPKWMKVIRLISLIIISLLTAFALVALVLHFISHLK